MSSDGGEWYRGRMRQTFVERGGSFSAAPELFDALCDLIDRWVIESEERPNQMVHAVATTLLSTAVLAVQHRTRLEFRAELGEGLRGMAYVELQERGHSS